MGTVVEFKPVSSMPAAEITGEERKVSIKDGYTQIADELIEKLASTKLGGREFRLLMVVIRKTYGYQKSEDWISLSQMADMSVLDKANCSRLVDGLVRRQILTIRKRGHDRLLSINTQIDHWQDAKRGVVKNDNKVVKNDKISCQKRQETRENDNHNKHINNKHNLKDYVPTDVETTPVEQFVSNDHSEIVLEMVNQSDQPVEKNHCADQNTMVSQSVQPTDQPKTKTRKPTLTFTEADMVFAVYMAKCIDAVNGATEKRRNLDSWANELRKMREIDGRDPESIVAVFNWVNQDDFWQTNIQSPATLKKKFAMLHGKYLKATGQHHLGNHHENNGSAGQQHRSQQEYINDLRWMDEL